MPKPPSRPEDGGEGARVGATSRRAESTMPIHIYICTCIHIYIYIYVYMCMYVYNVYIYIYICIHTYILRCLYVCRVSRGRLRRPNRRRRSRRRSRRSECLGSARHNFGCKLQLSSKSDAKSNSS